MKPRLRYEHFVWSCRWHERGSFGRTFLGYGYTAEEAYNDLRDQLIEIGIYLEPLKCSHLDRLTQG